MKITEPFVANGTDRRRDSLVRLTSLILEKLRALTNDVDPAEVLPENKCRVNQLVILEAAVTRVEFCDLVVGDVVERRL